MTKHRISWTNSKKQQIDPFLVIVYSPCSANNDVIGSESVVALGKIGHPKKQQKNTPKAHGIFGPCIAKDSGPYLQSTDGPRMVCA